MWFLAGFGSQLAGMALLRRASGGHIAPGAIGAALIAASLLVMGRALGVELGLSWALLTLSVAAYLPFAPRLLATRAIGRAADRTRAPAPAAGRGGRLGLALRLLAAGPLHLLAALAVGAVIATRLPMLEVNRLMLGGLLVPVVWALGALHATADLRVWRVLAAPVVLAAVSTTLFVLA